MMVARRCPWPLCIVPWRRMFGTPTSGFAAPASGRNGYGLPAVILVGNDGLRRPCDWVTVCLYMLSVHGFRRRSVSSDPLRVTLVGLGLPFVSEWGCWLRSTVLLASLFSSRERRLM